MILLLFVLTKVQGYIDILKFISCERTAHGIKCMGQFIKSKVNPALQTKEALPENLWSFWLSWKFSLSCNFMYVL